MRDCMAGSFLNSAKVSPCSTIAYPALPAASCRLALVVPAGRPNFSSIEANLIVVGPAGKDNSSCFNVIRMSVVFIDVNYIITMARVVI